MQTWITAQRRDTPTLHTPARTAALADHPAVPFVVDLDDQAATDADIVGAKAAALARARSAGMPALPGFAISTAGARAIAAGRATRDQAAALLAAWQAVSEDGAHPVVVRSSSTAEDGGSQSMAGLFTSVLDVRDWERFLQAVDEVIASGGDAPIAVLVQRFLRPTWGGVLFGADPVTGRTDRIVVAAVPGGPDQLVSGQVNGGQLTLSRRGRLQSTSGDVPDYLRRRRFRRALVLLARTAASTFGGPQDIEWAIQPDGTFVLLQSRPITALGNEPDARGPVLGPGPVAETFGLPLRTLEEDLWVDPLRDALRETLRLTGAASARQLRRSPVVVTVGGRVAADLELLGIAGGRRSLWSRIDPLPPARRLRAAWRVGRLRVALPALARDVITQVDDDLRAIPALDRLTPEDLVRILRRSHQTLKALHGHEILAGMLVPEVDDQPSAAAAALRVLAAADDAPDAPQDMIAAHPVLLSLTPPRVGGAPQLPPRPAVAPPRPVAGADEDAAVREALRLRVRWVQELTARVALELGRTLVHRGVLSRAEDVVLLRLDELTSLVECGGAISLELRSVEPGPPLPASFRLTDDGLVVPVHTDADRGGVGAGGGRGSGPVHVGTESAPAPGAVLVVRTLDPALAPLLPGLGGLVAETGSVLSHLAILAREYGVPTVVGLAGATEKFTDGTWVVVDGTTGDVSTVESHEWGAA